MNTQMDRPRDNTSSYGKDDPHHDHHNVTGEGHDIGGEHHGEKKSVLKKVKAKAKKIKDTIKGHVGHGHDHDDDDDEMDTDPDIHGSPGVHGINVGKDGIARQHGTEVSERTAIGGHDTPNSNSGAYQVFKTTKTHYVPGQEETLSWSRTDTGTLPGSGNQTGADRHALGIGHASHASGNRSTGDLGVGHKPKFGGILEKDFHATASYPAQVSSPSGAVSQGIKVGEEATTRHHGTSIGERTAIGGHVPAAHGTNIGKTGTAKQHGINIGERAAVGGHAPASEPGAYQVFDTTTTHYVPGLEGTLGWSRTDTGPLSGTANQLGGIGHPPVIGHSVRDQDQTGGLTHTTDTGRSSRNETGGVGHTPMPGYSSGNRSTGDLGVGHKPKLGGIIEKDSHVMRGHGEDVGLEHYQAHVNHPTGGAQDIGLGRGGGTTRPHPGEGATMERTAHIPVSKPVEYHTFDTPVSRDIPVKDETTGWSITDIGRSKLSEEQPYAPKNTPITAHQGHHHTGALRIGERKEPAGSLGVVLDREINLERDPHAPRDVGEKPYADNYQSKVTDTTGRGGEEIGVTPILHQLGKMDIHDGADTNLKTGQTEHLFSPSLGHHQKTSTGSHDQFTPETMSNPQFDARTTIDEGLHDEERKPGSYTEKISSVASELAQKAKVATDSVTSNLGYGWSQETLTNASTTPGGFDQTHEGQLEHLFSPSLGHHQKTSTGSHDQFSSGTMTNPQFDASTTIDQGLHDEERKPGGYTEKISTVASELAQKAKIATGSVTSKLGYGGSQETPTNASTTPGGFDQTHEGQFMHGEEQSKTYGKKVYEKVAELGSTVASKVQGSGAERPTGSKYDVGPTGDADKGISVKEYLVEKLKPGEEDKALSNVITEALPLHKPEENPVDMGGGDEALKVEIEQQVIESDDTRKVVIKGKVTESEEVARQFGRGEDTSYDGAGPGLASPGKSVMDRIMDAAGSLFNTSGEPHVDSDEHAGDRGNERIQVSTTSEHQQNAGEPRVY